MLTRFYSPLAAMGQSANHYSQENMNVSNPDAAFCKSPLKQVSCSLVGEGERQSVDLKQSKPDRLARHLFIFNVEDTCKMRHTKHFLPSGSKNHGVTYVKILVHSSCFILFYGLEYTGHTIPLVRSHVCRMDIPRSNVDSLSQIFLCFISSYIYERKLMG